MPAVGAAEFPFPVVPAVLSAQKPLVPVALVRVLLLDPFPVVRLSRVAPPTDLSPVAPQALSHAALASPSHAVLGAALAALVPAALEAHALSELGARAAFPILSVAELATEQLKCKGVRNRKKKSSESCPLKSRGSLSLKVRDRDGMPPNLEYINAEDQIIGNIVTPPFSRLFKLTFQSIK